MKKISEQECFTRGQTNKGGGRKKLWLKFHWYCSLICSSGYVHLKVVIFCNAKKVSKFVFLFTSYCLRTCMHWAHITCESLHLTIKNIKISRAHKEEC